MRRPGSVHPTASVHVPLMLALTFSTGVIDAVGYLGLDRVFTGNMTGNVVILGMALTGAEDLPVLGPVIALVGFAVGACVAGVVLRGRPKGWSGLSTGLFGAVAVTMLLLVALLLVTPTESDGRPPEPATLTVTALLGAAMGLQAATARHLAVTDVTTVVVTSTITGLFADLFRRDGTRPWRRAAAVVLIGAGATAGALLLMWDLAAGIALSAVVTLVVAFLGHRALVAHRRHDTGGPA